VVPRLVKFVDLLTNWYVRSNRRRLKVKNIIFWLVLSFPRNKGAEKPEKLHKYDAVLI